MSVLAFYRKLASLLAAAKPRHFSETRVNAGNRQVTTRWTARWRGLAQNLRADVVVLRAKNRQCVALQ
jgi:hypothetical protein